MYMTPIIYNVESLVESGNSLAIFASHIINLNPLTHYVGYFRQLVLYGTVPSLTENLICIGWAVAMVLFGLLVFKRKQDKFILYI